MRKAAVAVITYATALFLGSCADRSQIYHGEMRVLSEADLESYPEYVSRTPSDHIYQIKFLMNRFDFDRSLDSSDFRGFVSDCDNGEAFPISLYADGVELNLVQPREVGEGSGRTRKYVNIVGIVYSDSISGAEEVCLYTRSIWHVFRQVKSNQIRVRVPS